jgi:hypothetical protein
MSKRKAELKKEEEEAIKLHKKTYGKGDDATSEPSEVNDTDNPETSEPKAGDSNLNPGEPTDHTTPVEPAAAEPTAEPTDWEARAKDFESRLKVVQGKYENEVPELHKELALLRETIVDIQQSRIASPVTGAPDTTGDSGLSLPGVPGVGVTLPAHGPTAESSSSAPGGDDSATVALDPTRFADYGEEIQDMAKVVNELKNSLASFGQQSGLINRIASLEKQIHGMITKTVKNESTTFESKLTDALPGVDNWGDDPVVTNWLEKTIEPKTGFNMMQIAAFHYGNKDAEKYIEVMKEFVKAHPSYRSESALKAQVVPDGGDGATILDEASTTTPNGISLEEFEQKIKEITKSKQTGKMTEAEYNTEFSRLNKLLRGGK